MSKHELVGGVLGYIATETEPADFVLSGGGRLAVRCDGPWRPDSWFVGWSPRNLSDCVEGAWSDWVTLAKKILDHEAKMSAPTP